MHPLDTVPHFSMIIRQRVLRVSRDLVVSAALSGGTESPAAKPIGGESGHAASGLDRDPSQKHQCLALRMALPAEKAGARSCPFSTSPHSLWESQTDGGIHLLLPVTAGTHGQRALGILAPWPQLTPSRCI